MSLAIACLVYDDLIAAPGSTRLAFVILLLPTEVIAAVAPMTAAVLLADALASLA